MKVLLYITSSLLPLTLMAQTYLTTKPLNFNSIRTKPIVTKTTQPQKSTTQVRADDFDRAEKPFELELGLHTRGGRIEDDNIRSSTSLSQVSFDFAYNMTTWLRTDIVGAYTFSSGLAATVYGSEGSPTSGASLDEGSVTIIPTKSIEISGGIVETQFNPIYSVYGGDALAGLRETFNKEFQNGISIGLNAYQAVPTQLGTSNRVLEEDTEAYLILNNLNLGFKAGRSQIDLAYSKFDFFNMTRAAADDSKFLGNTMVGEDGSFFRFFRYEYKGQEAALSFSQKFRQDDLFKIRGSFAVNDEAPEKMNTGWLANAFYEYNFSRYQLRPSYTQFRLESDVIPAFYAKGALGFLNREGYSTELRGAINTYKVETYLRYTNSKEIQDTFVQSDRESFMIGLEVSYEIL